MESAAVAAAKGAKAKADAGAAQRVWQQDAYFMPPRTAPELGLGLPLQLGVSKRKKWKSAIGAAMGDYALGRCYGLHVPQVLIALWCGLIQDGVATQGLKPAVLAAPIVRMLPVLRLVCMLL